MSPAAAKCVLNTILVDRDTLGGQGHPDLRLRADRHGANVEADLLAVAFVDDWLGAMCNVTEVRKVWLLWTNWEVITGSKLGIKARGKTVCSPAYPMGRTGGRAR